MEASRQHSHQREWSNWSGSLRFVPGRLVEPEGEAELVELVRRVAEKGDRLRVVGAGHSSSPLVETDRMLVSLKHFQGLVSHDPDRQEATIRAGMTLGGASDALVEVGLAMENLGDVDYQTVAGAFGTGTHGSGRTLKNVSTQLIGGRMVTARGDVVEFSEKRDPEFLRAMQVSLGTLGILTEMRLKLLPAYKLHRREWCVHIDDCVAHFDRLAEENRNLDFYWYPRCDEAKVRILDEPGKGTQELSFGRLDEEQEGWAGQIIPKLRDLKFDEMEYSLPYDAGLACFQEVRKRVKDKHRRTVGWRVLFRTIAPDEGYLSTAHGRETATISLHQNAGLPFWDYFKDIEPIFRAYGGRPHWGKKHALRAGELRPLYPKWDRFQAIRNRMDPDGLFMTPYLRELLEAA